jgi:hypothetical protein
MANFRDTPGDKSHKALDFLLRRMFWEGAPNLESLKDTRTSEQSDFDSYWSAITSRAQNVPTRYTATSTYGEFETAHPGFVLDVIRAAIQGVQKITATA